MISPKNQAWSVFDRHQDRLDQQRENMLYCRKGLHLKSDNYHPKGCRACATTARIKRGNGRQDND